MEGYYKFYFVVKNNYITRILLLEICALQVQVNFEQGFEDVCP